MLPLTSVDLLANLNRVREQIDVACKEHNRNSQDITTIVVTKFHSAEVIRKLYDLGVRDFGENRHQEAVQKSQDLSDLGITWHYIGQLQTNKAKQVAEYANFVHSVDRKKLVPYLSNPDREKPLQVFLQINLTSDAQRGGTNADDFLALAETAMETPGILLRGVMAVAPLDEPARKAFAKLRNFSEELQKICPEATAISAGMSHDFQDAIAEGATHLRIGSSITGKRPTYK